MRRRILLSALLLPALPARADPRPWHAPQLRVRLLSRVVLGEVEVAALAFAADLPDCRRDLLALVDADGRVRGLEALAWRASDGATLGTRISTVSDGLRLRLQHTASWPTARFRQRETWTDYLRWQQDAPMADAPPRPVLEGTVQARLAAARAQVARLLTPLPAAIGPQLVAAMPSA